MPTEKASTGSLAGIRVIDASRVLGGPFCGQILADHGADVIKIEPPMGDETRGWGPRSRATPPATSSASTAISATCRST
ncbi:acyl-CoA transferase [Bordetella trematum]|uniref:Acyl-CoA transferase n=1 Tax=Bordetella trematum TaxID=123899 RepID=A0A157SPV7_9BORD|nr:acyl-CoA transferase [Bordetella trematum]